MFYSNAVFIEAHFCQVDMSKTNSVMDEPIAIKFGSQSAYKFLFYFYLSSLTQHESINLVPSLC
jgi:hypothetical protein